ncbi:hypothetical protein K503DRAFT_360281 [Rhizopogon vinicolor AM-OR11-026]|uniref:Uncharacterized protein n=1 Tax=Rhizopogon vinicolor AM-OR11-026 TaxID=1314800 RepID=A0A1B7MSF9_9AGAM|nr:hypothetical protein K503DRAFT_360281 [Rhizopogon vinicolor AM-OR11-026]
MQILFLRQVRPCRCTYTHPCTCPWVYCTRSLGNAEGAQSKMMDVALKAAQRSLTIVRLNQLEGDLVVHGRAEKSLVIYSCAGEEVILF